jgi:DNA replication protein DnaC
MLDPTPCPNGCDANGFLVDPQTRRAYPCSCRAERLRHRRFRDVEATVGRYAPARFSDLRWDRDPLAGIAERHASAATAVRRYAQRLDEHLVAGRGLWLLGHKGTGKTTLAYYVTQEARERGHTVLTRNTTDLLNELRDTYHPTSEVTTRQVIDAVTAVDLLHLEDLAVPRETDWLVEQLYTIVNRRYEANKPIVFTSDTPDGAPVEPMALGERVGPRTLSRLLHMVGDPVLLLGSDYRLAAGL